MSVQPSHLVCTWAVADDGVWKTLTARHGHLEALAGEVTPDSGRRSAVLQATLAQSRMATRVVSNCPMVHRGPEGALPGVSITRPPR